MRGHRSEMSGTKMDAKQSPVFIYKCSTRDNPINQDQNDIRRNKCKRTQKRER